VSTAPDVTRGERGRLGLYRLLDPAVLADPYPLYRRLREEAPVLWDPYLHTWVVTRYADVEQVLRTYAAARTHRPDRLVELGLERLTPVAEMMVRQMLFLDQPAHGRVRRLASVAFTPRQVAKLRQDITDIADQLIAGRARAGSMEVMSELAEPLPAIVTARMLGVPIEDHQMLKGWSQTFAEMLGNFQHNPGRVDKVIDTVEAMTAYFTAAVRREATHPTDGLIHALVSAEVDGDRLDEADLVANIVVTMVGGQETTTNLIGNGLLTLLRTPDAWDTLRADADLVPSAVEELLRYESPSQHTARLAPAGAVIGDREIPEGSAVMAVMGAANRDPERFPDPDRLDLARPDNRHLAFGWAAHFCFGAPLARLEGQIVFQALADRFRAIQLDAEELSWRPNLGLRGLLALPVNLSP
jgi:cytochrome P450